MERAAQFVSGLILASFVGLKVAGPLAAWSWWWLLFAAAPVIAYFLGVA